MSISKRFALAAGLGALMLLGACSDKASQSQTAASTAAGVTATRTPFGALADGTKIEMVELKNSKGVHRPLHHLRCHHAKPAGPRPYRQGRRHHHRL